MFGKSKAKEEVERLRRRVADLKAERERLKANRDEVKEDRDRYQAEKNRLFSELEATLEQARLREGCWRERLASALRGEGIEIGALHSPLEVPDHLKVRYVDLRTREENIAAYPELDPGAIVETDIVTNGETLEGIDDESFDFVIANHMLEHTINPLGTLERFLKVLRWGGHLFISLPDKRYTFDFRRDITPFPEVLADYRDKRSQEPKETYEEWVEKVHPEKDPEELFNIQENIHFHAWTQGEILELFSRARLELGFPIEIEVACRDGIEIVILARKERPEEWDRNEPETRESAAEDGAGSGL